MTQIISKRVAVEALEEGDIIAAAEGPAEVESTGRVGDSVCVSYRYLDSGDYHERYLDGLATVYLEHPAIGAAKAAGGAL